MTPHKWIRVPTEERERLLQVDKEKRVAPIPQPNLLLVVPDAYDGLPILKALIIPAENKMLYWCDGIDGHEGNVPFSSIVRDILKHPKVVYGDHYAIEFKHTSVVFMKKVAEIAVGFATQHRVSHAWYHAIIELRWKCCQSCKHYAEWLYYEETGCEDDERADNCRYGLDSVGEGYPVDCSQEAWMNGCPNWEEQEGFFKKKGGNE